MSRPEALRPLAVDRRCTSCSATVRATAPWCTQCYAALPSADLPAGVPPTRETTDRPAEAPARAAAPRPAVGPGLVTWPCSACGAGNGLAETACAACGTPFLATLRSSGAPQVVVPGFGDLGQLSRGARLGLASCVVVAWLLLCVLAGLLL